jgi:glycosyltransferase involved in cell wall biosynthesis
MEKGLKSLLARMLLHYLRSWDLQSSSRVDHFIANSDFVRQRIRKTYRRDASVVHPPVDVEAFDVSASKTGSYVTVSRLVPYKMVGLLVEAFNRLPDRQLRVIGDGPQRSELQRSAGPNVHFLGSASRDTLRRELQGATAFVFAALEDFGISAVEAQACGTPVIAFGRGGLRETVVPGKTGVFFDSQTPEAVIGAIHEFERTAAEFDPAAIRAHARQFSIARFRQELRWEIESRWLAGSDREPAAEPFEIRDDTLAAAL